MTWGARHTAHSRPDTFTRYKLSSLLTRHGTSLPHFPLDQNGYNYPKPSSESSGSCRTFKMSVIISHNKSQPLLLLNILSTYIIKIFLVSVMCQTQTCPSLPKFNCSNTACLKLAPAPADSVHPVCPKDQSPHSRLSPLQPCPTRAAVVFLFQRSHYCHPQKLCRTCSQKDGSSPTTWTMSRRAATHPQLSNFTLLLRSPTSLQYHTLL